jgi:hypothetical protein
VVRQGLAGEVEVSKAIREAVGVLGWDDSEPDSENEHDARNPAEGQAENGRTAENGWTLESLPEEIEGYLLYLRQRFAADEERFRLRLDVRRLELQAPPLGGLELSMRYETMLERQL